MSVTLQKTLLPEWLVPTFHYDPSGVNQQSPRNDFERSLRKISMRLGETNVLRCIAQLEELAGDDPQQIFPTKREIVEELLPLLHDMRTQYPFCRTGLSISSPVADPENISLNMIIRLYNSSRQLGIKIKIGVFCDHLGDIYYEVGYVDLSKSLFQLEKNFLDKRPSKGDYNVLQQLVNCTKNIMRRRSLLKGLDLTPAYYHVLPLCIRLGGKPDDEVAFNNWQKEIENAAALSIQLLQANEPDFYRKCQTINRRYIISWLFMNEKMICPVRNKPLTWNPPRLIWTAP